MGSSSAHLIYCIFYFSSSNLFFFLTSSNSLLIFSLYSFIVLHDHHSNSLYWGDCLAPLLFFWGFIYSFIFMFLCPRILPNFPFLFLCILERLVMFPGSWRSGLCSWCPMPPSSTVTLCSSELYVLPVGPTMGVLVCLWVVPGSKISWGWCLPTHG